ncbi:ParA family protein [Sulfobacillus sp. hq2]|uniref:ParA family protein n=1 Tax=Sulfobacillus sp. hq2 TaxID=2039167 RepID=UPI000CD2C4D0|nr:ParA family protein [Sulfobacillus sp. hq2]POB12298.1 hypothetical protein CO251_00255 [Sulfobacillus sp. hq2]
MANLLVVHNRKGGAGKTTMSLHLAGGLAMAGLEVCLIDGDPQGNCALGLGLDFGQQTATWLVDGHFAPESVRPHWDLLKSGPAADLWWEHVSLDLLTHRAKDLKDYDWVIVDTAPGDSSLNRALLAWTHALLIPVNLQFYSAAGVANLLTALPAERVLGIVPNFYDLRTSRTREVLASLKPQFPGLLAPRPIRQCVTLERASQEGKLIWEWDPRATAADDYLDLIEWMVTEYGENIAHRATH